MSRAPGYVAGCNTRWFAKDEDGDFTSAMLRRTCRTRLSFADDDTDRYASMLAFPCYEGQFESGQLDTVMSVTTAFSRGRSTTPACTPPSRAAGGVPGLQRRAAARTGALRRGHEGRREPGLHQPGLHKQRNLLSWSQPPLRPVHLAASCLSSRARATLAPTPSLATRAGVAGRACRSRLRATACAVPHKLKPPPPPSSPTHQPTNHQR